jgi:hypothetical protein
MTIRSRSSRADIAASAVVVSFSFTLLAASFAVFAGALPLGGLDQLHQTELGALLFLAPIVTLILAVLFEASHLVLRHTPLPDPIPVRSISWDRRDG